MTWPLIGVWRWIAVVAVLDFAITTTLVAIHSHGDTIMIPIVMFAYASGAASIGALAFWARDRWLSRNGFIHRP